jgi:hypothetical protein
MIAFLLKNWQLVAIAILSAALATSWAYVGLLKKEKIALTELSVALRSQLQTSQASVTRLTADIEVQNAKVKEFEEAAQKRLEGNKKELDKAGTTASNIEKQANELLTRKQSKDSTACLSALDLVNGELNVK